MNVNLIDVGIDESKFVMENETVVEYEVSDNVSLMYNKGEGRFYIYGIDYGDDFDDYFIDIDDDFDGIEVDGVTVTKSDFEEFKRLISSIDV